MGEINKIELINGNPVVVKAKEVITAAALRSKTYDILSEEITTPDGITMTKGEKILRNLVQKACDGSGDSISEVLDRTLGKPVQQNVNLNQEISYADFLKMLNSTSELPTLNQNIPPLIEDTQHE